ncbi:MAG TPA: 4Fe-4S dicluster domain-containing protein [Firmicutes bacterium]|nr:4Fe-4S dicluster domain-containing protein [Bacillota bacterium]
MVEISHPKWPGWKDFVTSCLYPVMDGLIVRTQTDRVRRLRATVLELLLARCPDSDVVRKLAHEYGVDISRYEERVGGDNCILCGLCVRVCDEVIGQSAIWSSGRGIIKEISTPLREPPPDCIGCGSCAIVCPTDTIPMVQTNDHRIIWDRVFELLKCTECGKAHITVEQRDWLINKNNLPADYYDLCDECKRKKVAQTQQSISAF